MFNQAVTDRRMLIFKTALINACSLTLIFTLYGKFLHTAYGEENQASDILKRYRRYLVYPGTGSSLIELVTGFGIPISVDGYSLTMAHILYYVYYLPYNGSQYTDWYTVYQKRDIRTPSRWDVYEIIKQSIDRIGFDGQACILRTICEAAQYPIKENNGLLGELLHLILSPSTSEEVFRHTSEVEYKSAEHVGLKNNSSCEVLYPECTFSFLDLISEFSAE